MLYLLSSIPHVMYTMYARYVIYAPSEKKLCTISVYLLSYLSHYIYIYIQEIKYFTQESIVGHKLPTIIAYDCGIKYNIIRWFIHEHKVNLVVVPFDYNLEINSAGIAYDGLFISNGPGDPAMCTGTIHSIKYALQLEPPKPIFGICLGTYALVVV